MTKRWNYFKIYYYQEQSFTIKKYTLNASKPVKNRRTHYMVYVIQLEVKLSQIFGSFGDGINSIQELKLIQRISYKYLYQEDNEEVK